MDGSDERAADERVPAERARPGHERRPAEQTYKHLRRDVRELQERLSQGAEAVAATENGVAATHLTLAERALREGRLEDARQLLDEAAAALWAVEHERRRADRWPMGATPGDSDVASAERARIAAGRALEDAARRRERAARLRHQAAVSREQAAQQRDEVAAERDQGAMARAVAAEEREAQQARWADLASAPAAGGRSGADEQQRAIDVEVGASYRAWAEDDRIRSSTSAAFSASSPSSRADWSRAIVCCALPREPFAWSH
jgi:hypothetical protein